MHSRIVESKSLNINLLTKNITDFALKEEYKRFESVGDKLAEISS
jgi:hypothetical protein